MELYGEDVDKFFPVAHTCFFALDLPAYSTYDILRDRLHYAVTECTVIDNDYVPDEEDDGIDSDEEDEDEEDEEASNEW